MRRFVLALVLLLFAAAIYAVTFAPGHVSNLRAVTADGETAVPIVSASSGLPDATAVPEPGWTVQPLVVEFQVPVLRDLPTPVLPRDPRLLLGVEKGAEVRSPDGVLRVELAVTEASLDDCLDELDGVSGPGGSGGAGGVGGVGGSGSEAEGSVLRERLASGAELHHVDTEDGVRGVLDLGDARVIVTATADEVGIGDYRGGLSALLESVALGG